MSRLLGYICSDDTLHYTVMEEVADELRMGDGSDKIGRGFGWVQEGRTLVRKQPPQGATGGELGSVVSDIPAREIVGYECDPDSSEVDTLDLQPFSYRTWVYAQDGETEFPDDEREVIWEGIPDHIRRNIDGDSLEELCFHVFLTGLHERGGFGLSQSDPEGCADALAEAVKTLGSRLEGGKNSDPVFDTDIVTISERLLLVFAGSDDVYYQKFEGIEEQHDEPLFAGHRPHIEEHPHFRAVLVTNGLQGEGNGWTQLPARHLLRVGADWEVHVDEVV